MITVTATIITITIIHTKGTIRQTSYSYLHSERLGCLLAVLDVHTTRCTKLVGAASVLHHLDTILLRRLVTTWKLVVEVASILCRHDGTRTGRNIVAAAGRGIVAVFCHHDPRFRRRLLRNPGSDTAALAAGRGGDRVRP